MDGVRPSQTVPGTYIGAAGDIPWRDVDGRGGKVRVKFFGESPEARPWVMLVWFAPGYSEPSHWHDHDTVYIPTRGAMSIGPEGPVRVGDVRWVRAGTYYGPEAASDEGCEFWLIASGPPGHHPAPPTKAELAALQAQGGVDASA